MMVPDLEHGFMIMGMDSTNRWWTGIECALARQVHGAERSQRAFLSHECRAEAVNEDPYSHPGVYEYVAISAWDGNHALRSGPELVGVRGPADWETIRPDASYENTEMEISVTCPDCEVAPLSFAEVKEMLQAGFSAGYRKLHMAISYRQDGDDYTLYAPCRYINFPHPTKESRSYLQPISGYVLYEKEGRFSTAYVVSYVVEEGAQSVQFKIRDRYCAGDLVTHEFCRVQRIDDAGMECTFFAYENA